MNLKTVRGILAAIVPCLLLVARSYGSTVTISVKCHGTAVCEPRGAVLLQSAASKTTTRRVNLTAASIVVRGESSSEWDVTLDAKGYWALPQRVAFPANDGSSRYALDVWRTGTLQGQVKLPDPQPSAPVAVKVVVASRPEPRVPPEIPRGTSFDCTTEKGGLWKCAVPATMLDVALRAEGYAPYHRWEVKVPVAGVIDFGPVKLQKGASVVAWLDSQFAKRVQVPVRALVRYDAAPGLSATSMRLAVPVAEGVFSKKGVVQLAPIAPGRYLLEVQAKGYAPARVPVQLYEGRETTPRRSIELAPGLSARFRIEPPLGPGEVPWRIELWRNNGSMVGAQDAGSGTASREGIFDAPDQVEGPVHLYVRDAKQNILASRDIVISPALTEYPVRMDVARVSGMVFIGDSALPDARLLFGGNGGPVKVRTTSDADGRFSVSLSRRGKWIVDVDARKDAVVARIEVLIDKDEVDIRLPATEVSGWVRDADGKRAPAAEVDLYSSAGPISRSTESDGTFRFRGISAGSANLQATDRRTHDYSKHVDVQVPDDGRVENVELNLESVGQLKGTVRSNGDAVIGAFVHGYPKLGDSWRLEQTTTDLQGGFAIDVPQSSTEAVITVGAPGRTLESFSVPTSQNPVTLELASRGGTLRLRWTPGGLPLQFEFNDHFLVSMDVFQWARGQGAKVEDGVAEIPNVAPGKYRFCSLKHCAEGLLAIGGQLELDATR